MATAPPAALLQPNNFLYYRLNKKMAMLKNLFTGMLLTAAGLQLAHAQTPEATPKKPMSTKGYFYLRAAGGYGWPGITKGEGIMGPKIDPFTADKDGLTPMASSNDTLHTFKPVVGSYGKGLNYTFAFGYMVNNYIGVELGVSYLKSATYSCTQVKELAIRTAVGPPAQFAALGRYMQANISTNAFGVSLMPAIVINGAKPGWKVYPTARLGISMPIFGGLTHHVSIDADTTFLSTLTQDPYYIGKHVDVTLKTEGTVSIGVNGAIGVVYRPLPFFAISAEINGQHLTTRAKSAKITEWKTDGVDRIPERGVYRTEFNFVDELTAKSNNGDTNTAYDKNKPKDDLRPTGSFSNIGFNIGFSFLLSKEILGKK
jgi:hypothetical protein